MTTEPTKQKPLKRIHIVGSSPRSGTTLVFELLTTCCNVKKHGDHEVSLFNRTNDKAGVAVSKNPNDLIHVLRVISWKKDLYCIYMERDPRDIIVSRHGRRPNEYWCDANIWLRNQGLISNFGYHPRLLVCHYEDLVENPDCEQTRILAAFPFLEAQHSFSDFAKIATSSDSSIAALGGVRNISAASVGKWKSHAPRVAAQLLEYPILPEKLVEAGYEKGFDWLTGINYARPDGQSSVRKKSSRMRGMNSVQKIFFRLQRRLRTLSLQLYYIASKGP